VRIPIIFFLLFNISSCTADIYHSNNISLIGMVVDSEANKKFKNEPILKTECIERQVPVYGSTHLKNTEVIVSKIMDVVAPGSWAVATKNFNGITNDRVKEYVDEKKIEAYQKIIECKTIRTSIFKEVIDSYTITVRIGEEDLKFISKEPKVIGSDISINVNRSLN
jgi:hypothetical protein